MNHSPLLRILLASLAMTFTCGVVLAQSSTTYPGDDCVSAEPAPSGVTPGTNTGTLGAGSGSTGSTGSSSTGTGTMGTGAPMESSSPSTGSSTTGASGSMGSGYGTDGTASQTAPRTQRADRN